MDRTCLACGEPLQGTRRRKYCNDACKKRYHRGARAAKETQDDGPKQPAGEGIQSTEAATMLALAEAGKLGTPGGQAALVLARRIDQSYRDTGSGLASMVKRLQETVETLTSDVVEDNDPLDELTRRRAEKQARAAAG